MANPGHRRGKFCTSWKVNKFSTLPKHVGKIFLMSYFILCNSCVLGWVYCNQYFRRYAVRVCCYKTVEDQLNNCDPNTQTVYRASFMLVTFINLHDIY